MHAVAGSATIEGLYCNLALAGSVKACFGHTEGAAGIHGAMLAILAVRQQAAPAIMHLRTLNEYVSNAIAEWTSSCNLSATAPKVTHWFSIISRSAEFILLVAIHHHTYCLSP